MGEERRDGKSNNEQSAVASAWRRLISAPSAGVASWGSERGILKICVFMNCSVRLDGYPSSVGLLYRGKSKCASVVKHDDPLKLYERLSFANKSVYRTNLLEEFNHFKYLIYEISGYGGSDIRLFISRRGGNVSA